MKTKFLTLALTSILLLSSCQENNSTTTEKIKEEEVLTALDELFEIVDKDIDRIDDIVTEDYFIFENSRKYTTEEFVEYVKSFGDFESKREFANIEIDTDVNSAHLSMYHHGEFDLKDDTGKIRMIAPVAIVFAISITAVSLVRFSAIKPDPTMIITRKQLPIYSERKYLFLFFI